MSRNAIRAAVAGAALALTAGAVSLPVLAATDASQPAAAGAPAAPTHHGGFHGGKGEHRFGPEVMWRGGLLIPGLGPISKAQLDALKLDASQQSLVQQARDAQRDLFKARHDAFEKNRELLDQQATAGKLDPRALVSAADASREQFRTQDGQVRDKWLAVWDSLNDTQRIQVAGFVKEREAHAKAMHERMEQHKKGPGAASH
jgi:hypothetical protein